MIIMRKNGGGVEGVYKLLLVEDDPGIAAAVRSQAEAWDFSVCIPTDFRSVMEDFDHFEPHIVLLDIKLPFYDGYHWCREIRQRGRTPIIFISSASDSMNIVMAMNMGADDFIAKPFDGQVLMAKIQALLRRSYDFAAAAPTLTCGEAILDTGEQSLLYRGERLTLTKNEYRILLCLMENKGRVVSRERLMERLWQTDSYVDETTLTVNVNRLRKKLGTAGLEDFIVTRFGAGYIVGQEGE